MTANVFSRRRFLQHSLYTGGVLGFAGLLAPPARAKFLPNPNAVVKTTSGKIRGGLADGVYIFRGIPYGADTGGANRFQPPKPRPAWTGVLDTLQYGNVSPQASSPFAATDPNRRMSMNLFTPLHSQPQSEDCLYLNVWSQGVGQRAERPVMVWLHGGGFATGSGASSLYEGTNLARRGDVVVVTLNHRLASMGFLNLAELGGERFSRSGMVGMMDIVLALQWVRDNIAQFGGDPNNVMIFGESGGGRKVTAMLGIPAAKGLFHRAVIESGPGIRFPTAETASQRAGFLMDELGLKHDEVDKLLQLPFGKITAAQSAAERRQAPLIPKDASPFESFGWAPVPGPDLPHWPFDPVAPQESIDVPVIIGTNRYELALMMAPNKALDHVDDAILLEQVKGFAGDRAESLIKHYKQAYPNADLRDIMLLSASDNQYRRHSITIAERKSALKRAPIYMYRFDWQTPVWDGLLKASHALEISFVFDNVQMNHGFTGGGPDAVALAAAMSKTWMQFARTGNPNNANIPTWKPYDTKDRATLLFNDTIQLVNDPDASARKYWQSLG